MRKKLSMNIGIWLLCIKRLKVRKIPNEANNQYTTLVSSDSPSPEKATHVKLPSGKGVVNSQNLSRLQLVLVAIKLLRCFSFY